MTSLLPQVKCVLVLDEDGARVTTKYHDRTEFPTTESELSFEAKLFKKTKNVRGVLSCDHDCMLLFQRVEL
ncbi:unnamed protein product [Choristocarpus tenellus]